MAKAGGLWALGGATAAAAALLASPAGYDRLRRLVRRGGDDGPLELAAEEPAALDTREARLSLRARLAEAHELAEDEPTPARPPLRRPERVDSGPLREAVEGARGRMREKAQAASTWEASA